MNRTIRDLFTEEEWDVFCSELLPELNTIGELPLPDILEKEAAGHET